MTFETWNSLLVLCLVACWGSFLNVVAYRLLYGVSFWKPRSECPQCATPIAPYDLIPVLSWLMLAGKCRSCKNPISGLYLFIECLTIVVGYALYITTPPTYWLAYGLFASALIITIRTDMEAFIIFRFFTLGIIPFAFVFSHYALLPLTITQSLLGGIFGLGTLGFVRWISYKMMGVYGMGNGDPELLATVGVFLGPLLCWSTLILASGLGSLWGIGIMIYHNQAQRQMILPFGPFIAVGAFISLIFSDYIVNFILG